MKIEADRKHGENMKGTVEKFGLREESNRTFLVDKNPPQKSIFNIGHVRHNVHSKAMAEEFNRAAPLQTEPSRLMEWKENPRM
jgi:hypothetical protein